MYKETRPNYLDDLYYENLGEAGESLKESAPEKLENYRRVLYDYVQILKSKSKRAKFVLEETKIPLDYLDIDKVYAAKIKISPETEREDLEYAREILVQIINQDIKRLIYFVSADKKNNYVKIIETYSDGEILILDSLPKENPIFYPDINDLTISKEIAAIAKLKDKPESHHMPLLRLAGVGVDDQWVKPNLTRVREWKVLTNDGFPGVNEQRSMVQKALSSNDFAILEGPPGSGKTTVITEIILQLLSQDKRVLLVGSTHVAVDNVLEKVIRHKDLVVPIRIAPLDQDLSPEVMKLTYWNYVRSFKKELLERLNNIKKRTEIQDEWIKELQVEQDNTFITHIINDSINLVSGTSIGVLQFPEIKDSLQKKRFDPLFDVMILDEASKTTFQEFLTPAMFARKWIVSGDPKQLSPYTDRDFIEEQIESLLRKEYRVNESTEGYNDIQEAALTSYWAERIFTLNEEKRSVMVALDETNWHLNKKISDQLRSMKKDAVIHLIPEKVDETIPEKIRISGSDIVIGKLTHINNYYDSLPYGIILPDDSERNPTLSYRNNFFIDKYNFKQYNDRALKTFLKEKKSLSQELAWRLIRSYEMRNSPPKAAKYKFEIRQFILDEDKKERIVNRLDNIKCSSLPSIIEILISGNSKVNQFYRESALESGLPMEYRNSIWTRLSYQYRMHPEISFYPRTLVYTSQDKKSVALKDSPMLKREWNYKRYHKRVTWLQVSIAPVNNQKNQKSNLNIGEVNKVLGELEHFLKFASSTRNPEMPYWTVALLSFYKPQTRELKKAMQKMFGGKGSIYFTADRSARIFVGNVDSMQGREADIVFLSMVRTGGLGFLDNTNRLNVAITRAKYQLVIVGNNKVFTRKSYEDTLIYKLASQIKPDYDFGKGK